MATDMFYGASAQLFENAKALRKAMTQAEVILWECLRSNKLNGVRFKAQHPIKHFIADFYCHAARLVIEIDGDVHDSVEQHEYDVNRTYVLEEFDLTVIRFRNEEVFQNLNKVVANIMDIVSTRLPSPKPPTP